MTTMLQTLLRKFLALVTTFAFFVTNLPISIAEETIISANAAGTSESSLDPRVKSEDDKEVSQLVKDIRVSSKWGNVQGRFQGSSDQLVIQIQDAHCNFEAQSNTARILDDLFKRHANHGLQVVHVEGSSGELNTGILRNIRDPEIRKQVALYYMKEGKISGAEFLAATGEHPFKILGVDDLKLYFENLRWFDHSVSLRDHADRLLGVLEKTLLVLKDKVFNPDVRKLIDLVEAYEKSEVSLEKYLASLQDFSKGDQTSSSSFRATTRKPVNIDDLKNVLLFLESERKSREIDFDRVEKERTAFHEKLLPLLNRDENARILTQTLYFRLEKISAHEYFSGLMNLMDQKGISRLHFKNFSGYAEYLELFESMDKEALFDELDQWVNRIKDRLFKVPEERELDQLLKNLSFLKNFYHLELSRKDLAFYQSEKRSISSKAFAKFLTQFCPKYNIELPDLSDVGFLDHNLPQLEKFYDVALKRDEVLVEKTLQRLGVRSQESGVKDKSSKPKTQDFRHENGGQAQRTTVLIAGGFHTDGIAEKLKQKGVSYLVVTPKITNLKAKSPYLSIMEDVRSPLEEVFAKELSSRLSPVARHRSSITDNRRPATRDSLSPKGQATVAPTSRLQRSEPLIALLESLGTKTVEAGVVGRRLETVRLFPATVKFIRSLLMTARTGEILGPVQGVQKIGEEVFISVKVGSTLYGIIVGEAAFKGLNISEITTRLLPQAEFEARRAKALEARKPDDLTLEQSALLDQVAEIFHLTAPDKMYLRGMWRQFLYPDPNTKSLKIIVDRANPAADANFILASMLTSEEREKILGAFEYMKLVADPANAAAAKDVVVTLNSLDGGIGESLARIEFLKLRAAETGLPVENVKMGAKGTDLGYDLVISGKQVFLSIAEVKILQNLIIADAKKFGGMEFQPLVNHQSITSYEKLLNSIYLFDRIDDAIPDAEKRTYRQVLEEKGIRLLPMLQQADLPGINAATKELATDPSAPKQPGGHGQWGVLFLFDAYKTKPPQDGKTHVRVFLNGDNVGSRANEHIAGAMARSKMPIVKLTTRATPIDKKGGKDGVRVVEVNGEKVYVPDQMELGMAKAAGQQQIFEDAGLPGGLGEAGAQPFNTNIFYFNLDLLHEILAELGAVIGEEELARVFSPTFIPKDKKTGSDGQEYFPIDGAIGNAVHNLNAFFLTSTDSKVKAILEKRGLDRLLYFVNVPRTEFFTPDKNPFDHWLQSHSDYYRFSEEMALEDSVEGSVPPEFDLDAKDKYWKEYQNVVDALGHASVRDLKVLTFRGHVQLKDAVLKGEVTIHNKGTDTVDLNSSRYAIQLPRTSDGRLVLKDVEITIDSEGNMTILRKEELKQLELIQKYVGMPLLPTDEKLIREMMRDYDYRSRGVAAPSPKIWFLLGVVWAKMALENAKISGATNRTVVLARDTRKIEPELIEALEAGLTYAGLDVVYVARDIPNAASSYSWAVTQYRPLAGIFITSSHVVSDLGVFIRGAKVSLQNQEGQLKSLTTKEIKQTSFALIQGLIRDASAIRGMESPQKGRILFDNIDANTIRMNALVGRIAAGGVAGETLHDLARGFGDHARLPLDTLSEWEGKAGNSKPLSGLKITVEGANTPSGQLTLKSFEALGAQVDLINGEIQELDGKHRADPSKLENLDQLMQRMKENKTQFGLAFDLDGDRVAIVIRKEDDSFIVLPPDNLMEALIPFLMQEGGYDPAKMKVAVIRDVLATEGVDNVAERQGASPNQTDSGYVFLKARAGELRKEGYIIPIQAERSGHAWLDVTGEYENPIAVAILYAVMAGKYKEAHPESQNSFLDVYQENTVPYEQSTRFQPPFHDQFLETLAGDERNDTGWTFAPGAVPNQKIIALGRDAAIRKALEFFAEGRSFITPAGLLKVRSVKITKDSDEDGGLYRFADIQFVDEDERMMGRFVFRASANDPTFVASFETPHLDLPTDEVSRRYISVGGIVLDWMESEKLAPILGNEVKDANTRKEAEVLKAYREFKKQIERGPPPTGGRGFILPSVLAFLAAGSMALSSLPSTFTSAVFFVLSGLGIAVATGCPAPHLVAATIRMPEVHLKSYDGTTPITFLQSSPPSPWSKVEKSPNYAVAPDVLTSLHPGVLGSYRNDYLVESPSDFGGTTFGVRISGRGPDSINLLFKGTAKTTKSFVVEMKTKQGGKATFLVRGLSENIGLFSVTREELAAQGVRVEDLSEIVYAFDRKQMSEDPENRYQGTVWSVGIHSIEIASIVPALADDGAKPTTMQSLGALGVVSSKELKSTVRFDRSVKRLAGDNGSWAWDFDMSAAAAGWTNAVFELVKRDIQAPLSETGSNLKAYLMTKVDTVLDFEIKSEGMASPVKFRRSFAGGEWRRLELTRDELKNAGIDITKIVSIGVTAPKGIAVDKATVYLSMVNVGPEAEKAAAPALADDGGSPTRILSLAPVGHPSTEGVRSVVTFDRAVRHLPTDRGSWLWDFDLGGAAAGWANMTFELATRDIGGAIKETGGKLKGYLNTDVDTVLDIEVKGVGMTTPVKIRRTFTKGAWGLAEVLENELKDLGVDIKEVATIGVTAVKGVSAEKGRVYLSMVNVGPEAEIATVPALADDGGASTKMASLAPVGYHTDGARSTVTFDRATKHLSTDGGSWKWEYDLKSVASGWANMTFELATRDIRGAVTETGGKLKGYLLTDVDTVLEIEVKGVGMPIPVRFRKTFKRGAWNLAEILENDLRNAGIDLSQVVTIGVTAVKGVSSENATVYLSLVNVGPEAELAPAPALIDDGLRPTEMESLSPVGYSSTAGATSNVTFDRSSKHLEADHGSWRWDYDLSSVAAGWVNMTFELANRNIQGPIATSGGKFKTYLYTSADTVLDLEVKSEGMVVPVKFRKRFLAGSWNLGEVLEADLKAAGIDLAKVLTIGVSAVKGMSAEKATVYLSMVNMGPAAELITAPAALADDGGSPTKMVSMPPEGPYWSTEGISSTVKIDKTVKHLSVDGASWVWDYDLSGVAVGWVNVPFRLAQRDIREALAVTGGKLKAYLMTDVDNILDIEIKSEGMYGPVKFRKSFTRGAWKLAEVLESELRSAGIDPSRVEHIGVTAVKGVSADKARVHLSMVNMGFGGEAVLAIPAKTDDGGNSTYLNSVYPFATKSDRTHGTSRVTSDLTVKHRYGDGGSWKWDFDMSSQSAGAWANVNFRLIDPDIRDEVVASGGRLKPYIHTDTHTILDIEIKGENLPNSIKFRKYFKAGVWSLAEILKQEMEEKGLDLDRISSIGVTAVKGISADRATVHLSMVKEVLPITAANLFAAGPVLLLLGAGLKGGKKGEGEGEKKAPSLYEFRHKDIKLVITALKEDGELASTEAEIAGYEFLFETPEGTKRTFLKGLSPETVIRVFQMVVWDLKRGGLVDHLLTDLDQANEILVKRIEGLISHDDHTLADYLMAMLNAPRVIIRSMENLKPIEIFNIGRDGYYVRGNLSLEGLSVSFTPMVTPEELVPIQAKEKALQALVSAIAEVADDVKDLSDQEIDLSDEDINEEMRAFVEQYILSHKGEALPRKIFAEGLEILFEKDEAGKKTGRFFVGLPVRDGIHGSYLILIGTPSLVKEISSQGEINEKLSLFGTGKVSKDAIYEVRRVPILVEDLAQLPIWKSRLSDRRAEFLSGRVRNVGMTVSLLLIALAACTSGAKVNYPEVGLVPYDGNGVTLFPHAAPLSPWSNTADPSVIKVSEEAGEWVQGIEGFGQIEWALPSPSVFGGAGYAISSALETSTPGVLRLIQETDSTDSYIVELQDEDGDMIKIFVRIPEELVGPGLFLVDQGFLDSEANRLESAGDTLRHKGMVDLPKLSLVQYVFERAQLAGNERHNFAGTMKVAGVNSLEAVVPVSALPDDQGDPTYIDSLDPIAGVSGPLVDTSIVLDTATKHKMTDEGSWAWAYNLARAAQGWAWSAFVISDRDITQEIQQTGNAVVGYVRPDVATTLDIELKGVNGAGQAVVKRFRRSFVGGAWQKVNLSQADLAGLDLTRVETVGVTAVKGVSADTATVALSMVKRIEAAVTLPFGPNNAPDFRQQVVVTAGVWGRGVRSNASYSSVELTRPTPTGVENRRVQEWNGQVVPGDPQSVAWYSLNIPVGQRDFSAESALEVAVNPSGVSGLNVKVRDGNGRQYVAEIAGVTNRFGAIAVPVMDLNNAGIDSSNIQETVIEVNGMQVQIPTGEFTMSVDGLHVVPPSTEFQAQMDADGESDFRTGVVVNSGIYGRGISSTHDYSAVAISRPTSIGVPDVRRVQRWQGQVPVPPAGQPADELAVVWYEMDVPLGQRDFQMDPNGRLDLPINPIGLNGFRVKIQDGNGNTVTGVVAVSASGYGKPRLILNNLGTIDIGNIRKVILEINATQVTNPTGQFTMDIDALHIVPPGTQLPLGGDGAPDYRQGAYLPLPISYNTPSDTQVSYEFGVLHRHSGSDHPVQRLEGEVIVDEDQVVMGTFMRLGPGSGRDGRLDPDNVLSIGIYVQQGPVMQLQASIRDINGATKTFTFPAPTTGVWDRLQIPNSALTGLDISQEVAVEVKVAGSGVMGNLGDVVPVVILIDGVYEVPLPSGASGVVIRSSAEVNTADAQNAVGQNIRLPVNRLPSISNNAQPASGVGLPPGVIVDFDSSGNGQVDVDLDLHGVSQEGEIRLDYIFRNSGQPLDPALVNALTNVGGIPFEVEIEAGDAVNFVVEVAIFDSVLNRDVVLRFPVAGIAGQNAPVLLRIDPARFDLGSVSQAPIRVIFDAAALSRVHLNIHDVDIRGIGPVPFATGKPKQEVYTESGKRGRIDGDRYIGDYAPQMSEAWKRVLEHDSRKSKMMHEVRFYSDLDTQARILVEHAQPFIGVDDDAVAINPVSEKPQLSRGTLALILNHETSDHLRGEVIPIMGDLLFFFNMTLEEKEAFIEEEGRSEYGRFILEHYHQSMEEQMDMVLAFVGRSSLFTAKDKLWAKGIEREKKTVVQALAKTFRARISRKTKNQEEIMVARFLENLRREEARHAAVDRTLSAIKEAFPQFSKPISVEELTRLLKESLSRLARDVVYDDLHLRAALQVAVEEIADPTTTLADLEGIIDVIVEERIKEERVIGNPKIVGRDPLVVSREVGSVMREGVLNVMLLMADFIQNGKASPVAVSKLMIDLRESPRPYATLAELLGELPQVSAEVKAEIPTSIASSEDYVDLGLTGMFQYFEALAAIRSGNVAHGLGLISMLQGRLGHMDFRALLQQTQSRIFQIMPDGHIEIAGRSFIVENVEVQETLRYLRDIGIEYVNFASDRRVNPDDIEVILKRLLDNVARLREGDGLMVPSSKAGVFVGAVREGNIIQTRFLDVSRIFEPQEGGIRTEQRELYDARSAIDRAA